MKSPSKSLLFHGAVYWLGKMLARSVSIVLLPIFTAHIIPSDYGVLSVLGMVMDVFMLILSLQLPSAIYRFWGMAATSEEKSSIIASSFIVTLVFPFVCLLPIYIWTESFSYLLGIEHVNLIRIVLFEVQVALIVAILLTDMRIHDESRLYALIEVFQNLATGVLSIFFVVYVGWGITGMITSQVIVFTVIAVCFLPRFLKRITLLFDLRLIKKMVSFSFPLIPAAVAMAAVHTSDRLFIQHMMSNADVGIYAIGYKFGMLVSFLITGPFLLVWEPKSFEIAQEEGSKEKYGEIFTLLVVGVSFVAVLLTGMSKEIVTLMVDEKYFTAFRVIPWVAWSYVFFAMAMVVRVGLLVEKKTILSAWLVFIVFIVNVAGNIILIPLLGTVGAAFSTLLSFLVYFVTNLICSQRCIPIKFQVKKIFILCVLVSISMMFLKLISIEHIVLSIICKLLVALILLVSLFMFGFLDRLRLQERFDLFRSRCLN